VFNIFQILSLNVSKRLRDIKLVACGVKIYIRDKNLLSYEFQMPLKNPSQSSIILAKAAMKLFKKRYDWSYPIRSLGLRAINLINEGVFYQTDLFSDYKDIEKKERIDKTIYEVRKKYNKK